MISHIITRSQFAFHCPKRAGSTMHVKFFIAFRSKNLQLIIAMQFNIEHNNTAIFQCYLFALTSLLYYNEFN